MESVPRMAALGLVLHPSRPVDRSLDTIVAWARGHDLRVLARETDRQRVPPEVDVVPGPAFAAQAQGLLALGGDGTMLGAMRLVVDRPVPVLGVNHGHLGFLVEVTPAQLPSALARLVEEDFTIEEYDCLQADLGSGALSTRFGFNDVVLSRLGRTGSVSVDLALNDQKYGYYRGDAVVVSTPTGSTAYNYAAGGPVLSPSSATLVLTPVAPMAGISRSVVLGSEDRVTLTVAPESAPIGVDIDGTPVAEIGAGETLTVVLRRQAAQVVRLSAEQHASRSRVKLSLLDLPLRRDQLVELIPPELRDHAPPALVGDDLG